MDTKTFIVRAKKIHGDKYDYSNVKYINNKTKVCIICPIHGEFWQTPDAHLRGCGCKLCGYTNSKEKQKKTKEKFISEVILKYGHKYDCSKVEYINDHTKVCIICHEKDEFGEEHGEFLVTPNNFLKNRECPRCKKRAKLTEEFFVKKSRLIHGDKYDYSQSKVNGVDKYVKIICPIHGEFWQTPYKHMHGQGCPKCGNIKKGLSHKNDFSDLIYRFNKIHNFKYNYNDSKYLTIDTKIKIICPIHGEFWQTPYSHLQGCGCPKCNESKLEREIRMFLENEKIDFAYCQRSIKWLNGLELDFYLPKYNVGIECQGIQHFKEVDFNGKGEEFAKKDLIKIIERDKLKKQLCDEHHIRLLYYSNLGIEYPYEVFEDKEKLLNEILKNYESKN